MSHVELLAPAGNLEAMIGAINAGADAVYLGGKKFGARAFSNNFEEQNLIDAIRYAHLRSVFVYVTINTLIFDDEVEDLLQFTDLLVKHHVDALIVQDLGMMDLLIRRYPNVAIHASTQMNIHNISQVKFLKKLGVKRIVMARETPLSLIRQIKKQVDIELEVFVHGALCVSYSGQCLMSSMQGGRSGNRGACAQPCRLTYKLFKENQVVSNQSYLLSTKDLMTIEYIDQLIEAGVDSFKIEGRMRKPEYVIQTVLSYRKAIENVQKKVKMNLNQEIDKLERVFNRAYTKGYVMDEDPKAINNEFRPNHLGVPIGTVINYKNHKAVIQLTGTLSVNDGYRIIGESDYGNLVSRIMINNQLVKTAHASDIIELDVPETVSKGSMVVKTLDQELESDLAAYLDPNYKLIGIKAYVYAKQNEPFRMRITDGKNTVESISEEILERAEQAPVTKSQIIEQCSKLGNTPFYLISIDVDTDNHIFIPIKKINELRRKAIEQLMIKILSRSESVICENIDLGPSGFSDQPSQMVVKVTTEDQLSAAITRNIGTIYHEDLLHVTSNGNTTFIPALKRIRFYLKKTESQQVVIQELGNLLEPNQSLIADEFLNVTNIYTTHLLSQYHVKSVTLSPEIGRENLLAFSKRYEQKFGTKPSLELVVYGREDLMISKYCPIAKTYKTKVDCHLCELNQYSLQDRLGQKMPLINDGNCNIRILNSKPLELIEYLDEIKRLGIQTLRLNFTVEDREETEHVIKNYQNAINDGKIKLNSKTYTTGRYLG